MKRTPFVSRRRHNDALVRATYWHSHYQNLLTRVGSLSGELHQQDKKIRALEQENALLIEDNRRWRDRALSSLADTKALSKTQVLGSIFAPDRFDVFGHDDP
jgi:hypothetical protein